MIRNRSGIKTPVPKIGICDKCKNEFPWFKTIQTWHHGRLCMKCYINQTKQDNR